MARISDKNPRYRTKETICKDLSEVLNCTLSYGTKMAVLNDILWVWSEFDGKIKGCKYWSVEAKKLYDQDNKAKLIHEHLVPRDVLRQLIITSEDKSPEFLYSLLNEFCIGVVVSKQEDNHLNSIGLKSKMPLDWNEKDAWARHKAGKISLFNN